jgi:transcriptional regulator with XRE-family HTH domain
LKKARKEMYIGIGLGRLRNERGWTHEKLAGDSDLAYRTVQNLEYNKSTPSGTTLALLAKAFEMEIDEFLTKIKADIIFQYPPTPEEKEAKKKKRTKKKPKS